jgi:hypothetical protein
MSTIRERIRGAVDLYSFNTNEKRDADGRWASSGDAHSEAERANSVFRKHEQPTASASVDEDGSYKVEHPTHGELTSNEIDNLHSAASDVDRANKVLSKHGHEPLATIGDDMQTTHDPDNLEDASDEVKRANKVFEKHGLPDRANLENVSGMFGDYNSSVDADELEQADADHEKVKRIFEKHGIDPKHSSITNANGSWESKHNLDDIESLHQDISRANKRLEAIGLKPNLKMAIQLGEAYSPHDLDEINDAIDVLKKFRDKERYSRREDLSSIVRAKYVLRDFAIDRYAEGHWITVEPSGTHIELDGKGNVLKGPNINKSPHGTLPPPAKPKVKTPIQDPMLRGTTPLPPPANKKLPPVPGQEPPSAPSWFKGGKKSEVSAPGSMTHRLRSAMENHVHSVVQPKKDEHFAEHAPEEKAASQMTPDEHLRKTVEDIKKRLAASVKQAVASPSAEKPKPKKLTAQIDPETTKAAFAPKAKPEKKPEMPKPQSVAPAAPTPHTDFSQDRLAVNRAKSTGDTEQAKQLQSVLTNKIAAAMGIVQTSASAINDFEARLRNGVANYAKRKSAVGQLDLFSGETRSSSKTQSHLDWDESKHHRGLCPFNGTCPNNERSARLIGA